MSDPDLKALTARYDVAAARLAIAPLTIQTPLLPSLPLGDRCRRSVWLKLENLQVTGSFKARGAAAKMLALSAAERARGVVTCSSGNHGRAVAYAARRLDIPATVCVPTWVDPVKLDAIRSYGAEAVVSGGSYDEAERLAFELADDRDLTFVHPFDDPHVLTGQGTIGLELLEQLPSMDAVLVPLSGGGLVSGIAVALKTMRAAARIIAVSARNARVMWESLQAGRPVAIPEEPTVASALSGGIDLNNRHTFALVRDLVDEHVLVSEEDIRHAMSFALREHGLVVEGGGAVGVAALLSGAVRELGPTVAVVVSGGNVALSTLAELSSLPQIA